MASLKYNKEPGFLLPGSLHFKGMSICLRAVNIVGAYTKRKKSARLRTRQVSGGASVAILRPSPSGKLMTGP